MQASRARGHVIDASQRAQLSRKLLRVSVSSAGLTSAAGRGPAARALGGGEGTAAPTAVAHAVRGAAAAVTR
eukprot:3478620-Pleurochrysis_carterae.AAC.1